METPPNYAPSHSDEPCQCPRSPERFKFLNIETGEILRLRCKSYVCPFCGPRKVRKLKHALTNYFEQFDYVRLWTFTMSNRFFFDPNKSLIERQRFHATVFQDAWKRFTRDLRRCGMLTAEQQSTEYVRVTERHQSGFIHFHVLVTEFLPVNTIRYMWRVSVSRALASHGVMHTGYVGNVNVKGTLKNATNAAKYVTKYLTKSIEECNDLELRKRWVKSQGTTIFEKREKSSTFVLIRFTAHGNMFAPHNEELNNQLLLAQKTHPTLPENPDFPPLILKAIGSSTQKSVPIDLLTLFEVELTRQRTADVPSRDENGNPIDDADWFWLSFGE